MFIETSVGDPRRVLDGGVWAMARAGATKAAGTIAGAVVTHETLRFDVQTGEVSQSAVERARIQ